MSKINIIQQGRSGKIQYAEGVLFNNYMCEFYWEFGGADVVAIISFPKTDAEWDKKYPWATGRRMEIVKDMAEQVRHEKSPLSTLKWEEGSVLLMSENGTHSP